jgi:hypothetical protein
MRPQEIQKLLNNPTNVATGVTKKIISEQKALYSTIVQLLAPQLLTYKRRLHRREQTNKDHHSRSSN